MKGILHRDKLRIQIESIFKQLVENGDINITYPISGRTDWWGRFFWGIPEECSENWQSPMIFVNNLVFSEVPEGLQTDKVVLNLNIGIASECSLIRGSETSFDQLWYGIQRFFGKNAPRNELLGTEYKVKDFDGNERTLTGGLLGNFGFLKAQLLGSIPKISNGKIVKYEGFFVMEILFKSSLPLITGTYQIS